MFPTLKNDAFAFSQTNAFLKGLLPNSQLSTLTAVRGERGSKSVFKVFKVTQVSLSRVGTGVWRFVDTCPAGSPVGCPPRWVLSLPRHTQSVTPGRQHIPVSSRRWPYSLILPACSGCAHGYGLNASKYRIRMHFLPFVFIFFYFFFSLSQKPLQRTVQEWQWRLPGQLIPHPTAHPSPGDRSAGKTHQAQGTSATMPCLWQIFPIKTRRRDLLAV